MTERDELTIVVEDNYEPLLNYCMSRLKGDRETAKDIAQTVVTILVDKWDCLDRTKNVKAWLYRTADFSIKAYRSRKRIQMELCRPLEDRDINDAQMAFYDDYFSGDDGEDLALELEMMIPEKFRAVFHSRYVEDMTLEATSKDTGVPLSTVHLWLEKVKSIISEEVKKHGI